MKHGNIEMYTEWNGYKTLEFLFEERELCFPVSRCSVKEKPAAGITPTDSRITAVFWRLSESISADKNKYIMSCKRIKRMEDNFYESIREIGW